MCIFNGKYQLEHIIVETAAGDGRSAKRGLCHFKISIHVPPAPEHLLWGIRCNCQTDCVHKDFHARMCSLTARDTNISHVNEIKTFE